MKKYFYSYKLREKEREIIYSVQVMFTHAQSVLYRLMPYL